MRRNSCLTILAGMLLLSAPLLNAPVHAATTLAANPRPATGLAALLTPDVAARWYEQMSPMGARAAGFLPAIDPDASMLRTGPARMGAIPLPAGLQTIGSTDVIVHGTGDVGTQGETAIAGNASGTVLIAGYNDARGFPDPSNPDQTTLSLSGISRSIDGGLTWNEVPVGPGGSGTMPTALHGSVFGDPDVKFDPTRNVFFYTSIYVRPSDGRQGLCIFMSNADGSSWTGPIEITPAFVLNNSADKPFMDVNPNTGRILVTWTNFSTTTPTIRRSYSDDGGVTWAAVLTIGTGTVQGSLPRFLPGLTNATSTAYAVWRVNPTATTRNQAMSRSIDGGLTWSAQVNIDNTSYNAEDQIPGVDRVNTSPAMAVDASTGRVYVVYQRNSASGEGDVALRTFTGLPVVGAPAILSSNPGNDRAQFYPWVAVDQTTHRVHVLSYDQDDNGSGDLTELMHTYSDDQGVTWSRPTPLLDRPFRAGYGNDTSQPNLGDYLQAVAINGTLHSLATGTSLMSQFNEGLPALSLLSPDCYYDQLSDATQVASLRLASTTFTEACAPGNGALEPGESAGFTFTLENYVANAATSPTTLTGLTGTLSSATPGVTISGGPQSFPDVAPLAATSNSAPFTVSLDPSFVPGTYVNLLLAVQTNQGAIQLPYLLATGADDVPSVLISENFDAVVAPALPAGWSAVNGTGTSSPWITSTTVPGVGAGSKGAFHGETGSSHWMRLFSPAVAVPAPAGPGTPYVTVDFDIAFNTEAEPSQNVLAYDGAFLRITDLTGGGPALRSVLAEAFAERFTTGTKLGYPKHLPRSNDANYFEDMSVWAGSSAGIQHVSMKFPGAGMVGRTIQLRFEWTQDASTSCASGTCGVWIDNVVVRLVPTTGTFAPQVTGTSLTSDVNPQLAGSPVQFTATVSPNTATGSVEFFDGATSLGTAPVSAGTAVLSTSSLTTGNHSMTAQYSGDVCDAGSLSSAYSQDIGGPSGVGDGPVLAFALTGVSPNPVRNVTHIGYALPFEAPVELRILDLQGRAVALLAQGITPAGRHDVLWNGRTSGGDATSAGMYFVQLRTNGRTFTRRLVITR
jgi:hypothetical protein